MLFGAEGVVVKIFIEIVLLSGVGIRRDGMSSADTGKMASEFG